MAMRHMISTVHPIGSKGENLPAKIEYIQTATLATEPVKNCAVANALFEPFQNVTAFSVANIAHTDHEAGLGTELPSYTWKM
jgi:hypothetical protein